MNDDEANKIIAECMCCAARQFKIKNKKVWFSGNPDPYKYYEYGPLYTQSLDALVPVWKKLMLLDGFRFSNRLTIFKDKAISDISNSKGMQNLSERQTIQSAAAVATAKYILELEK